MQNFFDGKYSKPYVQNNTGIYYLVTENAQTSEKTSFSKIKLTKDLN